MVRVAVGSIVLAAMLAGCATRYQPAGLTGGYNDVRLNDTTYKVHVDGNGYTSNDRSSQLTLLRAADLTLQSGYDHFLVVSGGTQSSVIGNTPIVANKVGNTVFMSGGDDIEAPRSDMVIRMVKVGDPAFLGAVDAKMVYEQLKPKF